MQQATHDDDPNGLADTLVKPGDVIVNRYVVDEVLGSGGMGVVVLARHRALGHEVAIKFIRASMADDAEVFARFTREAKAVAGIQNEHLVRVLDFGIFDRGVPFMVMEYLDGWDLQHELSLRGELPVSDAADYLIQACDGLAAAHARGVVHRDIKLANLFLTSAESGKCVKVLDFGVSKFDTAEEEDMNLTTTSMTLGSPLYMSPEQLRDARCVDLRSDIWSLGIVLHRLLTATAPFQGTGFSALCAAVAADDAIPVRALRADLPEALENVVLKCLEKRPQDRYPNANALAQALAPFASSQGRALAERLAVTTSPGVSSLDVASGFHPRSHVRADELNETAAGSVIDRVARPAARKTRTRWIAFALTASAAVALTVAFFWSGNRSNVHGAAVTSSSTLTSAIPAATIATAVPTFSAVPIVGAAAETTSTSKPAETPAKPANKIPLVKIVQKPVERQSSRKPTPAPVATSAPEFGGSALDGHH